MLRRLKNFVNKEALIKIADSIFTSKIRYGLQLLGKIRWTNQDTRQGELHDINRAHFLLFGLDLLLVTRNFWSL